MILFEQWVGHRLLSEKVTRPHVRAGRPILIPSVPVSEGIEIRSVSSVVWLERCPVAWWFGLVSALWYWLTHVQVKASWLESVFSWAYVKATRILSSSRNLIES